jgi:hypothetical protein
MLSSEEMQDQLEKFSLTDVMEQKFLSGEGTEHMDYFRSNKQFD